MSEVTFITGNQNKADYLAELLEVEIDYKKVELDEIQSLDLHEIIKHKVKQAYELVKRPVLVEDVSLEFTALNGLPGSFIKFFVETTGLENVCKILDVFSDRSATAKCCFGFYDGKTFELFDGSLKGEIAKSPRGENGYGWDRIFIPDGYNGKTRAELDLGQDKETYLKIKPINQLRQFLSTYSTTS